MGSAACAQCGRVRWDLSGPCPECGSYDVLPDPALSIENPRPAKHFHKVLDANWRVVRDRPLARPVRTPSRRTIGLVIVAATILSAWGLTDSYLAGDFAARSPAIQVLIPDHGTYPGSSQAGIAGWGFTAMQGGTLEGGFVASNGSVEVCISTFNPIKPTPANPNPPGECPLNVTYSSGFVVSGHVTAAVSAGLNWLIVFASPTYTPDYGNWNVTWSPALEIVST
jgi:hypothetical protein